jgi:hypothetical protein
MELTATDHKRAHGAEFSSIRNFHFVRLHIFILSAGDPIPTEARVFHRLGVQLTEERVNSRSSAESFETHCKQPIYVVPVGKE